MCGLGFRAQCLGEYFEGGCKGIIFVEMAIAHLRQLSFIQPDPTACVRAQGLRRAGNPKAFEASPNFLETPGRNTKRGTFRLC